MPHRSLRLLAGVLGLLLGWCCLAAAQEKPAPSRRTGRDEQAGGHRAGQTGGGRAGQTDPPEPDKPTPVEPAAPAARKVEEAQPTLYHLKDKNGNLVPMPNFTLEDFEELYKLKHDLARQGQPPRYTLQQVSARGTATADHADLTVNVRIVLREDQWVRVPLRFDAALLREPATYRGPGEQSLSFEEGEGYVSWIRGQAGQQHELTLKFLVPLTTSGDDTRLRLTGPRATLSELKLKVPVGGAVAKVSEGGTLAGASPAGNGATEFSVSGLSGDFEMSWRKSNARTTDVPVTLDAAAVILAKIDGHGIESEATLSVRSHGAAFDRFRVQLPPGVDPPLGGAQRRLQRVAGGGREPAGTQAGHGRGPVDEEDLRPRRGPPEHVPCPRPGQAGRGVRVGRFCRRRGEAADRHDRPGAAQRLAGDPRGQRGTCGRPTSCPTRFAAGPTWWPPSSTPRSPAR